MCYIIIRSSKNLHNKMIDSIVECVLYYFDRTPTGRIINRFTNDIGTIDT